MLSLENLRSKSVTAVSRPPHGWVNLAIANLPENPEQCDVHRMKTAWTLTLLLLACPVFAQDAPGAAKV